MTGLGISGGGRGAEDGGAGSLDSSMGQADGFSPLSDQICGRLVGAIDVIDAHPEPTVGAARSGNGHGKVRLSLRFVCGPCSLFLFCLLSVMSSSSQLSPPKTYFCKTRFQKYIYYIIDPRGGQFSVAKARRP